MPLAGLVTLLVLAGPTRATDLTFLGWTDQHVQTDGSADHCTRQIAGLNTMAGRAWPTTVGGTIGTPSFILGAGDITEWPTHAAKETYDDIVTNRLIYPTYDVMGNHDTGGQVPSDTVRNWFLSRYGPFGASAGQLSYSFNADGVHFSMLDVAYDPYLGNPAQPIDQAALTWLAADLAGVDSRTPVVIVTHPCRDSITNLDAFVGTLAGKNVVMILGGHYETPALQTYGGYMFVRMAGPRSDVHAVHAFHITDDRLAAGVWNVDTNSWMPQYTIDTPIQTPEPASSTLIVLGALAALAARRKR